MNWKPTEHYIIDDCFTFAFHCCWVGKGYGVQLWARLYAHGIPRCLRTQIIATQDDLTIFEYMKLYLLYIYILWLTHCTISIAVNKKVYIYIYIWFRYIPDTGNIFTKALIPVVPHLSGEGCLILCMLSLLPSLLPSSSSFLLPSLRLFPLVFADILAVLFARCRQMSTWTSRVQWAAPDLNSELQIAVGSAGPQPGSSGADWATPDLTRGARERSGQRRTSPGDLPSGVGSAGPQLPEDMSEDVSEICQKRMSEHMSENVSDQNVRKHVKRYVRR